MFVASERQLTAGRAVAAFHVITVARRFGTRRRSSGFTYRIEIGLFVNKSSVIYAFHIKIVCVKHKNCQKDLKYERQ